jgi:hypothetical protein
MAEEAGFSVPGGRHYEAIYRPAQAATSDDIRGYLQRFAALVAERCSQVTLAGTDDAERHSGAEAAGHLQAAADRILAEFPKP